MKNILPFLIFAFWTLSLQAQMPPTGEVKQPMPDTALVSAVTTEKSDIDPSIIDKSIDPCTNFYQYACGGWLAKTPIPADRALWARGFSVVDERNLETLKGLLEGYQAGKNQPENVDGKKLGDFYASCMDEARVERSSMKTLKNELKKIEDLKDPSQIPAVLAEMHLEGVNTLFSDGNEEDLKDPNQMIYYVDQGGLGLPDRQYYLSKDDKMVQIRGEYLKHVAKVLELAGETKKNAEADGDKILALETSLAQVSLERVARRDPTLIYHRLELKGLSEATPNFNWAEFLRDMGYPDITAIDVKVPDFFAGFNSVLLKTSIPDLKTYLKFHFIDDAAPALPKRFVNERFHFYGQVLAGQKQLQARWKRCVSATESVLGFALGHAFVDAKFGEDGKAISKSMIHSIESEFGSDLDKVSWMDKKTKKEAFRKLDKVVNKVGYPDKWRSYEGLSVDRKNYLKNILDGDRFTAIYYMNKIGKPVDRTEWDMTPQTVNAYYDAQFNQMVFPAGILQAPFFNRGASAPSNYGGIGMVMGHELTHGFDDQGRRYNADGALEDWWSDKSAKEFQGRTECLVNKYNQYTVRDNRHVNGKLTLGENIADQGGIKLSYEAWKSAADKNSSQEEKTSPSTGDFTDNQKFFLAFAQSWCIKVQPELERMLITVDVHSPGPVRVNGSVSNFKPFAETFQCHEGSPMAPKDRCDIW